MPVRKPEGLDELIIVGAGGMEFELTNGWSVTCLVVLSCLLVALKPMQRSREWNLQRVYGKEYLNVCDEEMGRGRIICSREREIRGTRRLIRKDRK